MVHQSIVHQSMVQHRSRSPRGHPASSDSHLQLTTPFGESSLTSTDPQNRTDGISDFRLEVSELKILIMWRNDLEWIISILVILTQFSWQVISWWWRSIPLRRPGDEAKSHPLSSPSLFPLSYHLVFFFNPFFSKKRSNSQYSVWNRTRRNGKSDSWIPPY